MDRKSALALLGVFLLAIALFAGCRNGAPETNAPAVTPASGTVGAPEARGADAGNASGTSDLTALIVTEVREQEGLGWIIDHQLEPRTQEVVLGSGDFTVQFVFADAAAAQAARVKVTPDTGISMEVAGRTVQVTGKGDWQRLSLVALPRDGEFVELRLHQVPTPMAKMVLVGAPQVRYSHMSYDAYPAVAPGPQEIQVSFNKPVDRQSVEDALQRGLEPGRTRTENLEAPRLSFAWQDDQHVTVRFTLRSGQPGEFRFTLAGAHDQTGAALADQLGLVFSADSQVQLWSLRPGEVAKRVGSFPGTGPGSVSPDGRLVAISGGTYALAESWETTAWLASPDGTHRYLGGDSDYLTWVSDGLLIHSFFGRAKLVPQAALGDAAPAAGAKSLTPAEANDIWWLAVEPGGRRLAYWVAHEKAHQPKLDLHVVDPAGAWAIERLTTGQYQESYRLNQIAAFGPDGALYWIERDADRKPIRLWRLTRAGRSAMPVSVAGVSVLQRAGMELALIGAGALFDPETGKTRTLPLGRAGDLPQKYWFSADGAFVALLSGPPDEKPQGHLYRLDTLQEVGPWSGIGYGFDAQGTFYYGVAE